MNSTKIAIIGCGNLGKSIVNGLIDSGNHLAQNIIATRRDLTKIEDLKLLGVTITRDNTAAVAVADVVIIALKPYNIRPVLDELKSSFNPNKQILVSLATSIALSELSLDKEKMPTYRAMPNTAADVGESMTCICSINNSAESDKIITSIFDAIGETIYINENLMEAATIIGACGIAYVLRFIRAMVQGGIEIGFDAETASKIVNQTVLGASELLIKNGNHPEFEIDKVTTPKGCTIVGLNEMEHNGFSSSLIKGIVTSYDKIK